MVGAIQGDFTNAVLYVMLKLVLEQIMYEQTLPEMSSVAKVTILIFVHKIEFINDCKNIIQRKPIHKQCLK